MSFSVAIINNKNKKALQGMPKEVKLFYLEHGKKESLINIIDLCNRDAESD